MGSPPRVRGKALPDAEFHPSTGITPACAGKSENCNSSIGPHWDHPRVCGEKTSLLRKSFRPMGSPPRVRGKGTLYTDAIRSQRITPACAGKRHKKF